MFPITQPVFEESHGFSNIMIPDVSPILDTTTSYEDHEITSEDNESPIEPDAVTDTSTNVELDESNFDNWSGTRDLESAYLRPSTDQNLGPSLIPSTNVRCADYLEAVSRPLNIYYDLDMDLVIELARWREQLSRIPKNKYYNFYTNEVIPTISSLCLDIEDIFNFDFLKTAHVTTKPSVVDDFLTCIKKKEFGDLDLSFFSASDVNTGLIELLPSSVIEALLPLKVSLDSLNFYKSFGLSFLGNQITGNVFRRAVAYYAITSKESFETFCDILREDKHIVLDNIKNPTSPTQVEIAVLSTLVDRNITIFEFDERGEIIDGVYYDFGASRKELPEKKTIYLGCFETPENQIFFPLIRKTHRLKNPPEAKKSSIQKASEQQFQNDPTCFDSNDQNFRILTPNGLTNNGNSCYVNATMQAVLSLPTLQRENLPGFMQLYFDAIYDSTDQEFLTERTKSAFQGLTEAFKDFHLDGNQQDAHEFLKQILFHHDSLCLRQHFIFSMEHQLKCTECQETRQILKQVSELVLPPNVNPEVLLGDMQLFKETVDCNCGHCNSTTMESSYSIADNPRCLLILTSFQQILVNQNTQDSLPLHLNVHTTQGISLYNLSSVVTHIGCSVTSGHYRAFLRQGSQWICCDDKNVTLSQKLEMENEERVYLKFYTKS